MGTKPECCVCDVKARMTNSNTQQCNEKCARIFTFSWQRGSINLHGFIPITVFKFGEIAEIFQQIPQHDCLNCRWMPMQSLPRILKWFAEASARTFERVQPVKLSRSQRQSHISNQTRLFEQVPPVSLLCWWMSADSPCACVFADVPNYGCTWSS